MSLLSHDASKSFVATALAAALLAPLAGAQPSAARTEGLPPRVDDAGGWTTAPPEALGFDAVRLEEAVAALGAEPGTRTLVVVRRGRIAVQRAWRGALSDPHDIKSASKSLLGLLAGLALERGELESVRQPVADFLPELRAEVAEPRKRSITIEHLLTMSSGLASTSGEHYGAWVTTDDWVAAALERPLIAEPGETFTYSTGNTHLLSAVLTKATGERVDELARRRLLAPIGADVVAWAKSPRGLSFGGNSVRMRALDLARVGQLVLQRGRWGERQVVPADWIEASTRPRAEGWPERYGAYGRLFWIPPGFEQAALAVGYGGQFLLVSPPHDAVVVLFSSHEGKGAEWDRRVLGHLREGVLGAVRRP